MADATNQEAKRYKISESDQFFTLSGYSTNNITVELASGETSKNKLTYINGKSISVGGNSLQNYDSSLNQDTTYGYHVHFDSSTACNLVVKKNNSTIIEIPYNPSPVGINSSYSKPDKLCGNTTSYELLRANPKLTGNIKVVVDSSSNLYLDTFKVSTALSQNKYRHIPINPDEYYGATLMKYIKDMPSDDLYKIEDGCYELFAPANDLGNQYYDTYNSGVRTNNDYMYSENFAMLAPLCVKKQIPDFFLIFKVDDGYNNIDSSDNSKRMDYFLSNGTLIKSFDLREGSNVGKYVRKIYEKSKNFVGDLFVGYDYDAYNTYNAISIDRGIVSKIYESTSSERSLKNQVAMNDWYTLGYQRNHIVSKDIINLEFMFDDADASIFSLNTYFGLYVRLNGTDGGFSIIGRPRNSRKFVFDVTPKGSKETPGTSLFNPSIYPKYIYGYSTNDSFVRTKSNVILPSLLNNFYLKPDKCLAAISIDEPLSASDSFCSVQLADAATPGEHYRIIDTKNKKIFEVLISNHKSDSFISTIERCEHNFIIDGEEYTFTISRCSVFNNEYRTNVSDSNKNDIIKDQIEKITLAFNEMSDNSSILTAYNNGEDCFSIIYHTNTTSSTFALNQICFEKVDSACGFSETQENYITSEDYEDISTQIFGVSQIKSFVVSTEDVDFQSLFYPVDFEQFGKRRARAVVFVSSINTLSRILYNTSYDITDILNENRTVLYRNTNSTGNLYDVLSTTSENYKGFPIKYFEQNEDKLHPTPINLYAKCVPGYGKGKNYLFNATSPLYTKNGKAFLYKSYTINAGLCSIFPVKDFNFNILDSKSIFTSNSKDSDKLISNNPGEFQSQDNALGIQIASNTEESITSYIDKSELYTNTNEGKWIENEGTLRNFLNTNKCGDHKKSDISLVSPYCCKWQFVGSDYRGLPMRVMFPYKDASSGTSSLVNTNSYFIPEDTSSYIGYCTLDDSGLNDTSTNENIAIKYTNNLLVRDENSAYRDYIINGNGNLDDMLYSDYTKSNKWSKAYTYGSNSLEFISSGIKIRISSNNKSIINVTKYNGYSAALICMSGNNPLHETPCEIIIDETKEQLLYIVYNGLNCGHMKYSTENKIYNTTSIPHHTAIEDCTFKYINGDKMLVVPDDAGYYNDTSLYLTTGYFIMSSPLKNFNEYTSENYVFVYGKIDKDKVYQLDDPNHLYIENVKIYVNSELCDSTDYTLKNLCSKYNNNTDVMIISYGTTTTDTKTTSSPYNLKKIKDELVKSCSIQIKTSYGTKDMTGVDNLLSISVVEPYELTREDANYNTVTTGKVYTCYAEPVMNNTLEFYYSIDSSIDKMFNTSFDGCNISISDVNNIYQTWVRKVIIPDAKLAEMKTDQTVISQKSLSINLSLKELGYGKAKQLPNTYITYYQSSNDASYGFTIYDDNGGLSKYQEYTLGVDSLSGIKEGAISNAYIKATGEPIGKYYIKSIDSSNNKFNILTDSSITPTQNNTTINIIGEMYEFVVDQTTVTVDESVAGSLITTYTDVSVGDKYKYTENDTNVTFEVISKSLIEKTQYTFQCYESTTKTIENLSKKYYILNVEKKSIKLKLTQINGQLCQDSVNVQPEDTLTFTPQNINDIITTQNNAEASTWKLFAYTTDDKDKSIRNAQSDISIHKWYINGETQIKGTGDITLKTTTSSTLTLPSSLTLIKIDTGSSFAAPSVLNVIYHGNDARHLTVNSVYSIFKDNDGSTDSSIKIQNKETSTNVPFMSVYATQTDEKTIPTSGYLKNDNVHIHYSNVKTTSVETHETITITTVENGSLYYHGGSMTIKPSNINNYQLIKNDSSICTYDDSGSLADSIEYTSYTINSEDATYEITKNISISPSIAILHNISPMVNCWNDMMYRLYTNYDDYGFKNGKETGYEKNKFFASRGLSLKDNNSRELVISDWSDFETDNVKYKIKIDLTTNIINKILTSVGYLSNWNNLTTETITTKNNYIENSILKYIKINNSTKVKVYKITGSDTFGFGSLDTSNISKYTEVTNVSNSLSLENDHYYMTFDNLSKSQYAIKIIFST